MIPGYNHNIRYKDRVFHVQTEDSGTANPHIITHLFVGGNIIESRKTSYAEHVGSDRLTDVVVELMQAQHKGMLRDLIGGKCDDKIATRSVNAATLNGPAPLNVDAGAQHRSSLMMGQSNDTPAPKPVAATASAAATPTMTAPTAASPAPTPAPKSATPAHLITRMPAAPTPAPMVPASASSAPAPRPAPVAAGPTPVLPAAAAPRPAPAPTAAPLAAATTAPTRFPVATPTATPAISTFAPRAPSPAAPPGAAPAAVPAGARPIQMSPPPPAKPVTPPPAVAGPVVPAPVVAAQAPETVISADTLARAFGAPSDSAVDSIFGEDLISEKSLDEVILSYLADDIRRE